MPGRGAACVGTLAAVLAVIPARSAAHELESRNAAGWASEWSFEPWVLACLAVSLTLYATGLARLWRRAGSGRGVRIGQALAFAGGWLALAAALVSPIDPLGTRLFWAHMLQHELLMVVAAPLMVMGRPLAVWTWALPAGWRRAVGGAFARPGWRAPWGALTAPLSSWTLHAAALWLWHVPAWFDAGLTNEAVHTFQHVSFVFTALLFWWSVLGTRNRSRQGTALMALFTTLIHTGALGALLTLSPTVWYPHYLHTAPALGVDPLEDQQLGGLLMWIPAGLAYVGVGLALAARWLQEPPPGRQAGEPLAP
jgi:putative membrane protein